MKDVNMAGFSIPTRTNMSRTQSQAELESEAPCKRIRRQEGDSCSMQVEMIGPQIDQRPPTRNEDEVLIQVRRDDNDLQWCDCIFLFSWVSDYNKILYPIQPRVKLVRLDGTSLTCLFYSSPYILDSHFLFLLYLVQYGNNRCFKPVEQKPTTKWSTFVSPAIYP
jgi:hypothetical protein